MAAVVLQPDHPAPPIDGELSLSVGAGRGGYREIGGALVLKHDDPAHGLTLATSHLQWRATGGFAAGAVSLIPDRGALQTPGFRHRVAAPPSPATGGTFRADDEKKGQPHSGGCPG